MSNDAARSKSLKMPDGVEIIVAPTSALDQATKDEIVALCNRAFNEVGFNELFDLVKNAIKPTHVMARLDRRLVSHAMWGTRELYLSDGSTLETAYVDAVATDPDMQGRGVGSAVIKRLTEEISDYDIGCLSTERTSFYGRIGWEIWTGPKAVRTASGDEPSVEDWVMIWRTGKTPALDLNSVLTVKERRGHDW